MVFFDFGKAMFDNLSISLVRRVQKMLRHTRVVIQKTYKTHVFSLIFEMQFSTILVLR